MKHILLFIAVIISSSIYSQKVFDSSDTNYFIDYSTNTLNLKFKNEEIKGSFSVIRGKDYSDYLLANGGNIHLVMKMLTNDTFYGIDVLKGNYSDVIKGFNKGRKYNKNVELIYTSLPSTSSNKNNEFNLVSEKQLKRLIAEKEFSKLVKESDYEGVYYLEMIKHDNLDYQGLNVKGKMIITDVGITIETEIPSLSLLRGGYEYDNNSSTKESLSQGLFTCYILAGSVFYDGWFTLAFNKESGVGGFTTTNGKYKHTTTFKVINN